MPMLALLEIQGIPGEHIDKQDPRLDGKIELLSYNWGFSQAGSLQVGASLATGGVTVQDITITKYLDKSSPLILEKCCTGEKIDKAILRCVRTGTAAGPHVYLEIEMDRMIVSGYATSGTPGDGGVPMETISLNFARVNIQYFNVDERGQAAGVTKAGYDIAENRSM